MDYNALHAVNDHVAGHTWLEPCVAIFAGISPIVVLAALAVAWSSIRPGSASRLREGVVGALFAAALAMGINQVISHIWARPRPSVSHGADVHLWFTSATTDPSFPSDHASAAFAVGFALLFVSRRWGIGMVLLATAIAVSRVAIGLHYPGDVLAGVGVGLLAAFTVMYVARRPLEAVAAFVGCISDRVVAPVWNAAGRRMNRLSPS